MLEMSFEKVMNARNEWMRGFNADGKEADKIKNVFIKKGNLEESVNEDVKEAISQLKKLQEKYNAIKTTLSAQTYTCEKCVSPCLFRTNSSPSSKNHLSCSTFSTTCT